MAENEYLFYSAGAEEYRNRLHQYHHSDSTKHQDFVHIASGLWVL